MDLAQEAEIIERLRDRVEQTKALYERAKKDYRRTFQYHNDLPPGHPDGDMAHVIRVERFAQQAYSRALRNFNRFILCRELPIEGGEADQSLTGAAVTGILTERCQMAKRDSGDTIFSPASIRGSSCDPPKGTDTDGVRGYGVPPRTSSPNAEQEVIYDRNSNEVEKHGDL